MRLTMDPFRLVQVYIERMDSTVAADPVELRRAVVKALPPAGSDRIADLVDDLLSAVEVLGTAIVAGGDAGPERRAAIAALDRLETECRTTG